MGRVPRLALLAGLVCALASCEAMFDLNVFRSLDRPTAPVPSDYTGDDGLARLGADLGSPTMVAALEQDPSVIIEIEANLKTTYLDDGISGTTDQTAAILYCDLVLKTSPGEDLVNNAVSILAGGLDPDQSLGYLVGPLIPADATSPEGFAAMIQGLLDASSVYEALGGSVDPDHDGVAEGVLPGGTLPGDIAQKAAVAAIVAQVIGAIDGATTADPIQQLYYLLYDPASVDPAVTGLDASAAFDPADPLPAGTDALLDLADMSIEA